MERGEDNREIELKLAVRPEHIAKLRGSSVLTQIGRGRPVTRNLESVYYDTVDMRLSSRMVTLRVRKQGQSYIQTIKSAPIEGEGLARGEWECPLAGPDPDLTLVVDAQALALLGTLDPLELRPIFTTLVKRTTRMVRVGEGVAIEVAIDEGEIRTIDGLVLPLSEIELELKEGEATVLYDLALELAKQTPLRLETRTKAARGYALAQGALDGSMKAEKVDIDTSVTVEGALQRIVRSCLGHLAANEACALRGEDAEGIHQMRVSLRRLRSALTLFRPFLPIERYDWLVGEVKWLGATLGPARDWDVFQGELFQPVVEALEKADGHGRPLAEDLEELRRAVAAKREDCYRHVRDTILSDRYTAFQLKLGAWLEARGWREQSVSERSVRLFEPVESLADHLLTQRHKRARKAGAGFAELSIDARHQLRIAMKKLRYAAEFFRGLYDEKPTRRYIQQLAGFQDALGHLNDVATATRLLHDLHADGTAPGVGEARAAGIVIGWHARGVAEVEPLLNAQWAEFAGAKPFWSKPVRLA